MTTGFVYIIESPSASDLLDGRTEGLVLREALRLSGTSHTYSMAADLATFDVALGQRLVDAWKEHNAPPILHLSMHGNSEGIAFTSGDVLTWDDLRVRLLPLMRAMPNTLLICMSSCFGFSGCRIAMHLDSEPHFWALVGHPDSVDWADAAVAYIAFYHRFFKGSNVLDSVAAMKEACGDDRFLVTTGADTRQSWANRVAPLKAPSIADFLRSVTGAGSHVAGSAQPSILPHAL